MLLSVTQAAERIGVSRQRVHQYIKEGRIAVTWVGAQREIEAAEVERFKATPPLPSGRKPK